MTQNSLLRSIAVSLVYHTSVIWTDVHYLSAMYFLNTGKKLDLNCPKTFSEKLQWLKLFNRNPEYAIMADKVRVKEWVAKRIGDEYLIPTIGVWESADDIDFDSLPDKFVIKCNHNSGTGMCICRDKSQLDVEKVRKGLHSGLKENYYLHNREWPYKDIPRRIIAEEFLEDNGTKGDLADYKFYCFNGVPKFCQVIRDRSTNETIDIYDNEWNLMPFIGLNPKVSNGLTPVKKPESLSQMLDICRTLSYGIPFCRIDLYSVNGRCYFGEVTFFPNGGFGSFRPEEWNERLAELIHLEDVSR